MKGLQRFVLWVLVLIPLHGRGQSATFTLPTYVLDSMIWEVQKGRACDTALNFALQTIESKNVLIDGQGKIIELRDQQIENYALLDANWSARLQNQTELFQIERSNLKQKIRKRNKILVGQGLVIAILLALIVGG